MEKQFEALVISKTNQVKVSFLPRILEILQKPKISYLGKYGSICRNFCINSRGLV